MPQAQCVGSDAAPQIYGSARLQGEAMFQEERTYLLPLPVVGTLALRPKFPFALSLTKGLLATASLADCRYARSSTQIGQPTQPQELGFSVGAIDAVVVGNSKRVAGCIDRKTLHLFKHNAPRLL